MGLKQWYMEYTITKNRPGLLGDIASLAGMIDINIAAINGLKDNTRALLLETNDDEKIVLLGKLLKKVDNISVKELRPPDFTDLLALRHGKYIEQRRDRCNTFRFLRDELGLLVDLLGEIFKKEGRQIIGFRGMPRIGKTESVIAGSVCANKRWIIVSSTLLRQTIKNQLSGDELNRDHVFIIDGIVSALRAGEEHRMLVRQIMNMPSTIVVEHPDIFVQEFDIAYEDFYALIELRYKPDEEITYNALDQAFETE